MSAAVHRLMGLANQARTPGRSTLLDGVNVLLQNIGEQPVNTLENPQAVEASLAERTLLEFHKEGQTRGWTWNREKSYEFAKDTVTGEIRVPDNIASWTPDPYEWAGRFQLRGQLVYDLEKRTTKLPAEISTLAADVIWLLSWDECPEAYNRWTTIRASRVFSDRTLGSDALFRFTAVDEQAAMIELHRVEMEQAQPNSLTGGPGLRPFPTYSPGMGLGGRAGRGVLRG